MSLSPSFPQALVWSVQPVQLYLMRLDLFNGCTASGPPAAVATVWPTGRTACAKAGTVDIGGVVPAMPCSCVAMLHWHAEHVLNRGQTVVPTDLEAVRQQLLACPEEGPTCNGVIGHYVASTLTSRPAGGGWHQADRFHLGRPLLVVVARPARLAEVVLP